MRKSGYEEKVVTLVTLSHKSGHFPLIFHSFALPLNKVGCTRKCKEKCNFPLAFHSFALPLQQLKTSIEL